MNIPLSSLHIPGHLPVTIASKDAQLFQLAFLLYGSKGTKYPREWLQS
jgi:hypothetical protein